MSLIKKECLSFDFINAVNSNDIDNYIQAFIHWTKTGNYQGGYKQSILASKIEISDPITHYLPIKESECMLIDKALSNIICGNSRVKAIYFYLVLSSFDLVATLYRCYPLKRIYKQMRKKYNLMVLIEDKRKYTEILINQLKYLISVY